MPRSPLPPRDGISAACLRAPGGKSTSPKKDLPVPGSIGQWLISEFPDAPEARLRSLLVTPPAGGVVDPTAADDWFGDMRDLAGNHVTWGDPVVPGGFYFYHRPVKPEVRIPFEVSIVAEDADILVVDKPHYLASTPNGRFVRESVVTRMRVDFGNPDLVAIHRLDRITAGLLILSKRPETRGTYQRLFQDRLVTKTYRALAAIPDDPKRFPLEVRSRLVKPRGERQVLEVDGEVNAFSRVCYLGEVGACGATESAAIGTSAGRTSAGEPTGTSAGRTSAGRTSAGRASAGEPGGASTDGTSAGERLGLYELSPVTGKTHQLRVHMASIGLPIRNDPVYPVDLEPDPYDFSAPLQLLAASIEFDDPLTGEHRCFESRLRLGE